MNEQWELLYPDAGASGLVFSRSRVDSAVAGERVLVHAAPRTLNVTVRDDQGNITAQGRRLERTKRGPMSALLRANGKITLEDVWPDDSDVGLLVLLPGGEAGILKQWWHADDHSAWRWQVEFSNSR